MAKEKTRVPVVPNSDFVTEFEESEYLAGILHQGQADRTLTTATKIGPRSFSARTSTVQWGKYNGNDAVLVVFSLAFEFDPESRKRFNSAIISVALEETADDDLTVPSDRSIDNDPIVRRIGPAKWEAEGHIQEKAPIRWEINPELSVGDTSVRLGSMASELRRRGREYCVRLQGNLTSSGSEYPEFNAARWTISEDGLQKAGITSSLRVALVAEAPRSPAYPFLARVSVDVITSSVYSRNLHSKNDAPIFLDRKTPKPIDRPCSYGAPNQDFADKDWPWKDLDLIPSNEKVCFSPQVCITQRETDGTQIVESLST